MPATGQVLAWDGAQWTPQAFAGGSVASMFGRTGVVTAQAGDYSFGQISGTVGGRTTAGGGRRLQRCSQRSDGGGHTEPAGVADGSVGGTSAGVERGAVGAAGPGGRECDEYVRAHGNGDRTVGRLLFRADLGNGGKRTVALGRRRFERDADERHGEQTAKPADVHDRACQRAGAHLGWFAVDTTGCAIRRAGGGGLNSVDKTVSNTYTAGAKQTFVPSLSTSGINIMPGTLPTNPAAGDISLDSGDANKLKVYDGGQWNTLVTVSNYVASFHGADRGDDQWDDSSAGNSES